MSRRSSADRMAGIRASCLRRGLRFFPVLVLGLLLAGQDVFSAVSGHTIIIVMDGARYSETWGDPSHANIPMIAALSTNGMVLTNFRTAAPGSVAEGWTKTCPGHARIVTGTYQNIPNNGSRLPSQPVIFQRFLRQTRKQASSCWLITSKDKLFILADSSAKGWKGKYRASMRCSKNGDGTGGHAADPVTHAAALKALSTDHPSLMLVNYGGPDLRGHETNWAGYLSAIKEVDRYVAEIWALVQSDPVLRDDTTLFVINDHGRHESNFVSHGDACEGCSHVLCVALGRGIKQGRSGVMREQIDLAPTIARIMGFSMRGVEGRVMEEILSSGNRK